MNTNLTIVRPNEAEYKKCIKMLNKIFMLNFSLLIPKLYAKGKDFSKYHYIVKEDDKIVGAIASVPQTFQVDGNLIKAKGVGMVGTRLSSRGKGIMSLMLETIYRDSCQDDTDIMFLSGNFNRYERFGFYPSGLNNIYKIRKCKDFIKAAREYKFVNIKNQKDDLEKIKSIYDQQDIRWDREDFLDCLKNWNHRAKLIYKNGELKGYMVTYMKNHIYEIMPMNANILEIITAYLTQIGRDSILVESSPYLSETNNILLNQSDNFMQQTIESWSIINWQHTLEVLFNAKLKREPLTKGKVIVKIDQETFLIEVTEDSVKVILSNKEPEVTLSKGTATRMFFGVNQGFETGNKLLDSWLPVPLYISSCDTM